MAFIPRPSSSSITIRASSGSFFSIAGVSPGPAAVQSGAMPIITTSGSCPSNLAMARSSLTPMPWAEERVEPAKGLGASIPRCVRRHGRRRGQNPQGHQSQATSVNELPPCGRWFRFRSHELSPSSPSRMLLTPKQGLFIPLPFISFFRFVHSNKRFLIHCRKGGYGDKPGGQKGFNISFGYPCPGCSRHCRIKFKIKYKISNSSI